MDCADHRDRSHARQRGFAMVDPAGVGTSSLVGRYRDAVSLSACHHATCAEAIHLLSVLVMELFMTFTGLLDSRSVKMALEIWKWQLPWTSAISSRSVGNDFQQPLENEVCRHFQCPTFPTPYGGPACAAHRRPAQAVGVDANRRDPE